MNACSTSTIWRRATTVEWLLLVVLSVAPPCLGAQDWWWTPTLRGHSLSQAEAGLSLAIEVPAGFDGAAGIVSAAWGLQAYRGFLGLGHIVPDSRQRLQWAARSASLGVSVLRTRHHPWFGNAESLYVGIEARWAPALGRPRSAWLPGLHFDGSVLHNREHNTTLAAVGLGWGF